MGAALYFPHSDITDHLLAGLPPYSTSWLKFLDHIEELGLADAPSMKPLVDGRLLSKSLGVNGGRWMGRALDVCLAWQFRNPGVEDPAGAIEEVKRRREELQIPGPF